MYKILVHSIDFDGCLYSAIRDKKGKYNTLLWKLTKEIIKNKDQNPHLPLVVNIFSGSQRQSELEELKMIGNHCSCAKLYQNFVEDIEDILPKDIKVIFNQFLLGDLFCNLPSGSSFNQMIETDTMLEDMRGSRKMLDLNKLKEALNLKFKILTQHFVEHSKLLLLYVQMQLISSEYPDAEIEYYFYDDKEKEILQKLICFFSNHKDWIPNNLTAFYCRYSKKDDLPVILDKISGIGSIDNNYTDTVKWLLVNLGLCSKAIYLKSYEHHLNINLENKKFVDLVADKFSDTFSISEIINKQKNISDKFLRSKKISR